MPPNRQQETIRRMAADHSDCYIIGEDSIEDIERFGMNVEGAGGRSIADAPGIPDEQLCAILFTSGSTGTPAPNLKHWQTLRSGTLSNLALLRMDDGPRLNMIATVPPQHMWGFETSILLPLFSAVAVSDQTPFFPQDIHDALAAVEEPRALVSSPLHLDAFFKADTGSIRIDRIFSATAPLPTELARGLEDRFGAEVTEIFGSSESGVLAARRTANEDLWQIAPLFDLKTGEDRIVVHAEHLPEDVVLNDVIKLVDGHRFRWLGRNQDMINIAGKRGSLAELNHRLTSIDGVRDGVIFMPDGSSRLAALVVAPGVEPSAILDKLKPGIEPVFLPRPLYKVSQLPRQETGKLARAKLVELFEATRRDRSK